MDIPITALDRPQHESGRVLKSLPKKETQNFYAITVDFNSASLELRAKLAPRDENFAEKN